MEMAAKYHEPVLLEESLEWLGIKPHGVYVDVTFGGGGHAKAILERLGPSGKLIAFDRDADAHENKADDSRLRLIRSDFKFIDKVLKESGEKEVDGILADLGISSHHVETPERGFSCRFDAPLDMRMDQRQELTASEVVNTYSEEDLLRIFRQYGELPNARRVVSTLIAVRTRSAIATTAELVEALHHLIPAQKRAKFLSQVFQAIRLEVNAEMEGLDALLEGGLKWLAPEGRMVIISYHSLEDRKVKNFFRSGNLEGKEEKDFFGNSLSPMKVLTRKAVVPTDEEITRNPRSRSARLRAAEKI